jgi:hypothetical protein
MKGNTDHAADAAPQTKPEDDPLVKIRVIEHGAKIGSLICALDHQQSLPLSKAKLLKELGKIEILGA